MKRFLTQLLVIVYCMLITIGIALFASADSQEEPLYALGLAASGVALMYLGAINIVSTYLKYNYEDED